MNDNKLIAEFMGYVYEDDRFFMEDSEGVRLYEYLPHELQYHSSWDWLMPVVKKIEEQNELIGAHILSTDIGKTHKEVVRFIKEYNNDTI